MNKQEAVIRLLARQAISDPLSLSYKDLPKTVIQNHAEAALGVLLSGLEEERQARMSGAIGAIAVTYESRMV